MTMSLLTKGVGSGVMLGYAVGLGVAVGTTKVGVGVGGGSISAVTTKLMGMSHV